MFILVTLIVARLILAFWMFVLWPGGRADEKYLERERLHRVLGEPIDG
jgi:hypothetical protein